MIDASAHPLLQLRGITKRFPGVIANDNVSLDLFSGEILALLGENGAGKTTLMNILYGLYMADEGEAVLKGVPVRIHNPRQAIDLGIAMVHQHFMLIPTLTVAENIILGDERTRGPLLDIQGAEQEISELARQYGLQIDPHARLQDLTVGLQQRVEILKALFRHADILILDEPTAVLVPQEVEQLFQTLRSLAWEGKGIILITHKLKEALDVADRIAVLRQGRLVGTTTPDQSSEGSLAAMMVGRSLTLSVRKSPAKEGDVALEIENLRVRSNRGLFAVDGAMLTVRSGEIVGIAGVEGNGQSELAEALTGLRRVESGSIRLQGQELTNRPRRQFIDLGVSYIPEDRQKHGLVLSYDVAYNLMLSAYHIPPFSQGIRLARRAIVDFAARVVRQFDIRTPSLQTPINHLSGGNQQKVVVGREFSRPIELLVAAQPTRGLDVGSTEFIRQQILQVREGGAAVILISSDMDEILALSDRIAVLFRGRFTDVLDSRRATPQILGLLMSGVPVD
ncbi:MAG: transporter related [Dehalococcoidia bacterium]|nr:transporter related [Dehalococcoidia bacterium]